MHILYLSLNSLSLASILGSLKKHNILNGDDETDESHVLPYGRVSPDGRASSDGRVLPDGCVSPKDCFSSDK